MRAFTLWPSSSLFFLVFRLSFAGSIFIPDGGSSHDDSSILSTSTEDGSPDDFDNLNFDSTLLLSQSDGCPNDDATKSGRKRQPNHSWCRTGKTQDRQQQPSPPKGQQDRGGWTDNKPYDGELPSQLRFLDSNPHPMAEPKPNQEFCGERGIFAVCAADKTVGWWGQPDSMQFKLDPCTLCMYFQYSSLSIGPGLVAY